MTFPQLLLKAFQEVATVANGATFFQIKTFILACAFRTQSEAFIKLIVLFRRAD